MLLVSMATMLGTSELMIEDLNKTGKFLRCVFRLLVPRGCSLATHPT